mmetsp:Transcript_26423/g.85416  ORF Transcript_26423/g.85416 Transcript_26423/m.85416 type:complete len:260 (-) Transcript_26423:308-1087(-)
MPGSLFDQVSSRFRGTSAPEPAVRGPCRVGFIGVARDRKLLAWARDNEEGASPILSERYAALGRKVAARYDPPGWDDVAESGGDKALDRGGGAIRAIKLPVCDKEGTTSYVVVFGCGFPLPRAQALCERLCLMLGPMVDVALGADKKKLTPEGALDLRQVFEREIEFANSKAKVSRLANQVEDVRAIMERNVELILDRGEKLDDLEAKSDHLSEATLAFKRQARKLKKWHLMNQVKFGLTVGTLVTASVAIPIAVLAVA